MQLLLRLITILFFVSIVVACSSETASILKGEPDVDYDIIAQKNGRIVSYVDEARPILEKRCVVCHGCYDAPCQLKMTSVEAIKRGANPKKVYDAERIFSVEPTRMFIDAKTEEEWRKKGFHSVLGESADEVQNLRNSVLYKMLRQKQINPQPRVGKVNGTIDLGLNRKQSCPTTDNYSSYAKDYPMQGMPFAMPNLSDEEYHILVKWISQGLPDDSVVAIPQVVQKQIDDWEKFLNKSDNKHRLASRYIYEHLFMGHLYFKGEKQRQFFRLVRSRSAPGESIDEIATVRAFDDPGVKEFYYRLRPVKSSIVDKSHVIYELSTERLKRYRELFIEPVYQVKKLPGYEPAIAANPIRAFISIPVTSRYKFLLDDTRFFIEGFIKGPVCRGQVALNVIEDNFWVFFTDPKRLSVNNDDYFLDEIAKSLKMPAERGDTFNVFSILTDYWTAQHAYMLKRQEYYKNHLRMDLDDAMKIIWNGKGAMDRDNRALTVFRHFDSASVKQGLHGDYPETTWVLDYPVLERIHYLLVAGYDVFGNVGHQLNTRLYMDFLRMEAENNFLAFLPIKQRKAIRDSWYAGIREDIKYLFEQPEDWLNVQIVFGFQTDDPQRELYQKLESHVSFPPDRINRCYEKNCNVNGDDPIHEKQLRRVAGIKGEVLSVFPDVSFLKVTGNGDDQAYTIIKNKAYKNISFILSDVSDRAKDSDTLTVMKGLIGSYPNFFFVVDYRELNAFATAFVAIQTKEDYERFVGRYGVRRTSSSFWKVADWFDEAYRKQSPLEYGIYDLYRYKNL